MFRRHDDVVVNLSQISGFGKDEDNGKYEIRFYLPGENDVTWSFTTRDERDEEFEILWDQVWEASVKAEESLCG